ncbi:uncharacterized protein [Palaemon carinicauda]|uniref:uncharacterized protein n=1 Tax=Palaemon carinicauda TaxID=392227 RepID=UPI0035B63AA4
MTNALEDHVSTVSIGGRKISNLRFADDIDGLAGNEDKLVNLVKCLDETSTRYGMEISAEKTKLMRNSDESIKAKIVVVGQQLETAQQFKYLELQRKIQAAEMRCFRRVLDISYIDHVTNEEVNRRGRQHLGRYEDLLSTVKKRKLKWYDHTTRSCGLSKTILQGTVQGKRRRGRQRKRWTDNIAEWTGKTFAQTQALGHDSDKWRLLLRCSTMQRPYNPGGLWDR